MQILQVSTVVIACRRSMVVDFVIYPYTGIYFPTDVYQSYELS